MFTGYNHIKELLRRSASVDIDKSDMKRLSDLIGGKLYDLLVIGVRNASYNNRDVIMEPDLPLTKAFLERMQDFKRYDEQIGLKEILEQLAGYPPLERALSTDVEAMLPAVAGTLAMLAGKTMKVIEPNVKNPDDAMWDKVFTLMDVLL
jgi:hypothetical protein